MTSIDLIADFLCDPRRTDGHRYRAAAALLELLPPDLREEHPHGTK